MAFGGSVKLTGENVYKKALQGITGELRIMSTQMKTVTSIYGQNDKSVVGLTEKDRILNKQLDLQSDKILGLNGQIREASTKYGENSTQVNVLKEKLNLAHLELTKMDNELVNNQKALSGATKEHDNMSNASKTTINGLKDFASELIKDVAGVSKFGDVLKSDMGVRFDNLKEKVKTGAENIKSFGSTVIENIAHPGKLGDAIKTGLINTSEKLKGSMDKNSESIEKMGDSEGKAGAETLKLGDLIKSNLISEGIISGVKALAGVVKEIGSAMVDVVKKSVSGFAEYEQLVGGVETLFKGSSQTVQNYANNAYKTAGMSANKYMETVTSFSASLLQGLNGDTEKAAKVADMAITDMSDNANKMGTSVDSIQTAYQGFAKQNYTMLDNLKLGYGGTKGEMERLLKDAEKLSGTKYDISNLSDVYGAINVVQTELGITGTTAKEATETISGSLSTMGSAWSNLLVGLGNGSADLGALVTGVIDSALTVVDNIMPVIDKVVSSILEILPQVLTKIVENLPQFLEAGSKILTSIIDGLQKNMASIMNAVMQIINMLIKTVVENLPQIIKMGIEMLVSLVKGIAESLPQLIPAIIDAVVLIIDTIIDNIDLIIDAGIQIIFGLIDGILDALPKLIDKIPELIDKLINAIVTNLPKLIEAGITLTIKLAEGLIKAVPQLVSKLPQIISSIVSGLGEGLGKIMDIGKNLVQGIWDGISNMTKWIKDKIFGFAKGITDSIKGFFGIHSPSTLFKEEIGKNLALGVGEGFEDTMGDVVKDMQSSMPTTLDVDSTINATGTSSNGGYNYDLLTKSFVSALRTLKIDAVLDGEEMGNFVIKTVEREVFSA